MITVEFYYFNIRTLDPWCCKVTEKTMTEEEFNAMLKDWHYSMEDDLYYNEDESIGMLILL